MLNLIQLSYADTVMIESLDCIFVYNVLFSFMNSKL